VPCGASRETVRRSEPAGWAGVVQPDGLGHRHALGEGASVGIHLVMTGARALLAGRISALREEQLVFKLAEKDDYALAGLRPRDMPDEMAPGRAFRTGSGVADRIRRSS